MPDTRSTCAAQTGSYRQHHANVFSMVANPAALSRLSGSGVGIFGERKFMMPELSFYTLAAALRVKTAGFGMVVHRRGYDLYSEIELAFLYGRKLHDKIDIGGQLHFYSMNTSGYGQFMVPGFEVGIMIHPTNKLHAGVLIRDPVKKKFGKYQQRLPYVYVFGLGYEASSRFLVQIEMIREEEKATGLASKFQYFIEPAIWVKGGISVVNSIPWFGAGWKTGNTSVDVSASYHLQLGITPALQFTINFPPKEE